MSESKVLFILVIVAVLNSVLQKQYRFVLSAGRKDDSKASPDLDQVRKREFHAIRIWVL